MLKNLVILIVSLIFFVGCATTQQMKDLQDKVNKIEKLSKKDVLAAAEEAAGTKMYGRVTRTGTNSLAAIAYAGLATGDQCIVIDSSLDIYFYKYDSTSTLSDNDPWVIKPTDNSGNGRWLLSRGIVLKNDDTNQSYMRLYEDYTTGQNYYELIAPSSIASNSTFYLGRWRVTPLTLTSTSTPVTVDNTQTLYYCTITGLTGNYGLTLPAATGSGVVLRAYVVDYSASFRFIIEPNGTDRIVGTGISGTNADGDYIYVSGASTAGYSITLIDAATGRWSVLAYTGSWSWE